MLVPEPLSPELRDYYDQLFATMATPGWKYLMEDAQRLRDSYNNVTSIPNGDALNIRKGQLDILDWMLGFKQRLDDAYKQLTEVDQ